METVVINRMYALAILDYLHDHEGDLPPDVAEAYDRLALAAFSRLSRTLRETDQWGFASGPHLGPRL